MTVAATPATSKKGDANGSTDVTVADVVAEIDYLTDQDPKPFIFEAADVNSDQIVNILDVVGTINIILQPSAPSYTAEAMATASYTIEDGLLYIDSPVNLAGLQILFETSDEEFRAEPLQVLEGMEYAAINRPDESQFMTYSLCQRIIPAGRHAVLRVGDDVKVKAIVLSDAQGHEVLADYETPTIIEKVQPEQQVKPREGIFDLMGRKVKNPTHGIYVLDGKKVCF